MSGTDHVVLYQDVLPPGSIKKKIVPESEGSWHRMKVSGQSHAPDSLPIEYNPCIHKKGG